jgi:N-acetylneuraminic acid mutarotase
VKALLTSSSCRHALAAVCLWLALAGAARAQGTAFTFQGRLTDGGTPANGNYAFQFALRDALTAGNAVGSAVVLNPVGVTNGLFTVLLDFGAGAFNGAPRWLEIGARTNGSVSAYTVLAPRTPVSAVPYAVFSGTTSTNSVDGLAAQVAALASQVATLTSRLQTNLPAGVPVVSGDAQDPALLAQGLQVFHTVPAPPWVNGTTTDVPTARFGHTTVWTGQQLLVWGGDLGGGVYSAGGGAYATASDLWQNFSTFRAPTARAGHTAVWTGTEMVIWGGFEALGFSAAHSRYHLGNGEWNAVSTTSAPAARDGHTALWTGTRMVIFSGRNNVGLLADGGAYDPAGNAWSALPTTGAPAGRRFATAVWTGSRAVYWGGQGDSGELASGGRLDCSGGIPQTWLTVSATGAPTARTRHTAVWTGSRMIVWGGQQNGGYLGDGAAYDPTNDAWTALPASAAPGPRANHVAVWSGTEMLIYGGEDNTGALASGAAYDPVKNTWRTLDTASGAVARTGSTAAWSGAQLLLFGGQAAGTPIASLQRLTPQPAFYFFRKP